MRLLFWLLPCALAFRAGLPLQAWRCDAMSLRQSWVYRESTQLVALRWTASRSNGSAKKVAIDAGGEWKLGTQPTTSVVGNSPTFGQQFTVKQINPATQGSLIAAAHDERICLSVSPKNKQGGSSNALPILLAACNPADPTQRWLLHKTHTIISLAPQEKGAVPMCLDAGSLADNTRPGLLAITSRQISFEVAVSTDFLTEWAAGTMVLCADLKNFESG
jgi:hypothetical protein